VTAESSKESIIIVIIREVTEVIPGDARLRITSKMLNIQLWGCVIDRSI
jgi:hypothetical protein